MINSTIIVIINFFSSAINDAPFCSKRDLIVVINDEGIDPTIPVTISILEPLPIPLSDIKSANQSAITVPNVN